MTCKALIATFIAAFSAHYVNDLLELRLYIPDSSGLGTFLTAFGAIYGVVVGLIVLEVWDQKNQIQKLLEKEAKDIEGMYFLVRYFKDKPLQKNLQRKLLKYLGYVLKIKNEEAQDPKRPVRIEKIFTSIEDLFDKINFNDEQDPIIFDQMLQQFKELRDTRLERIRESLIRIPGPIQMFITLSSIATICSIILTPFENKILYLFSVSTITFFVSLIHQIIGDLDNPFVGYWNVDFESLRKAKKAIKSKHTKDASS